MQCVSPMETGKVRESLEHENLTGIQGGINGFILIGSGFQDDTVTLKASFLYTGPGGLFRIFPVRIQLLGQARAWTGYNGSLLSSPSSEDMVYIARMGKCLSYIQGLYPSGTVYNQSIEIRY